MEIRYPLDTETTNLKQIWKICFGDEDSYIDFYFEKAYRKEQTLIAADQDRPVAMMTLIPAVMSTRTDLYQGAYIYAVATLPEYRKRGIMAQIDKKAEEVSKSKGYSFMTLVPANERLFSIYRKTGYEVGSYLIQREISVSDYGKFSVATQFKALGREYFIKLRQQYLSGKKTVIQFDGNMQDYLYEELRMTGCEVLELQNKFGYGHIVYYRQDGKLYLREAGVNAQCLFGAMTALSEKLGCRRIFLKTSADFNPDWDDTKPYSMIKYLSDDMPLDQNDIYMNLMLD